MSVEDRWRRLAEWLIKLGRDRADMWAAAYRFWGWDPFTVAIFYAFRSTGLVGSFARAKVEQIKYMASQRNMTVFEYMISYLDELIETLREEPEFRGVGERMLEALRGLVKLLTGLLSKEDLSRKGLINELYGRLRRGEVRGIGDTLAHQIVYDMIRLFGFPVPDGLGPSERLKKRLRFIFNVDEEELDRVLRLFRPEDWPYVDLAVWDLRVPE